MFIAIVATITNVDGWIAIATFAESKEEWLKKYIPLKNGVLSHDTFERIFENIDVNAFNTTLQVLLLFFELFIFLFILFRFFIERYNEYHSMHFTELSNSFMR
ncbi:transposase family protein [Marinisporobacter balticus]|uniref:transposase family protein n=1 Tax=Marinisporobacter balticus TaxID=2018667 RepID=UPI001404619B